MRKTRAAIYVRISEDKAGAGLGVARQEKDCRALAKRLGWTIVEVYVDNDLSAYSGKPRPAYLRLLEDIEAGRIDGVIVWHTDRLHRSTAELEHYINVARDVPVEAVQAGHIDLSTPTGRAVAKTHGAWAQHEVELKSERQKAKNRELAEAGKPMGGGRPFGFEADGITIRKKEAKIVQEATSRVLAGDSLASIIRDFNARGIVSTRGNQWRYSNLRSLLQRPRNAGLSVYKGKVIGKAQWKPLVSEADFYGVNAILSDPSRRTTTGNTRKHLMSGLAKCGICGQGMKPGAVRDRKGDRYMVYRCCVYRSVPKVDRFVSRVTQVLVVNPAMRSLLTKRNDVDLSGLYSEKEELESRQEQAAGAFAEGSITLPQLNTITERLKNRIAEIEAELARSTNTAVFGDLLTVSDVIKAWEALSIERKRAVIDALMTVTVLPVGRRGRGPQPISKGLRIELKGSGKDTMKGTLEAIFDEEMTDEQQGKVVAAFG